MSSASTASAGARMVAGSSLARCRNGHPIRATSAYCVTCGAPLTAAVAAATPLPDFFVLAGPLPRATLARPARNPRWANLAATALLVLGVVLLAVAAVWLF